MKNRDLFPKVVVSIVVVAVLATLVTGSWWHWIPTILALIVGHGLWRSFNQ